MEHGDLAIHLFFVLSGFLISRILIKESNQSGNIRFIHFYTKRLFRLIPASLFYLITISVLNLIHWLNTSWLGIIGAVLLFRNYIPATGWYSGHFWSLSVEEHYYLVWPLLLCLFPTKRRLVFTFGLLFLSILFRDIEYTQQLHYFKIDGIKSNYRTDFVMSYLLWGCALATVFEHQRLLNFLRKLCFPGSILIILIAQVLSLLTPGRFSFVLQGVLFCLMISCTLLHPSRVFSRFLEHPWMIKIGITSYSLYIWQQLFLSFRVEQSPLGFLQIFPVNIIATFAAAFLSYKWIEQPFRRYGRKLMK